MATRSIEFFCTPTELIEIIVEVNQSTTVFCLLHKLWPEEFLWTEVSQLHLNGFEDRDFRLYLRTSAFDSLSPAVAAREIHNKGCVSIDIPQFVDRTHLSACHLLVTDWSPPHEAVKVMSLFKHLRKQAVKGLFRPIHDSISGVAWRFGWYTKGALAEYDRGVKLGGPNLSDMHFIPAERMHQ